MGLLEGKVALITSAASGIGKGTAIRFAREGAAIGLADMLHDEGIQTQREIEPVYQFMRASYETAVSHFIPVCDR